MVLDNLKLKKTHSVHILETYQAAYVLELHLSSKKV